MAPAAEPNGDLKRKKEVLRRELYASLEETLRVVEERIRSLVPGVLGGLLNPVIQGLFKWVGRDRARLRGRRMIDFVLDVAASDREPETAAGETFEEFLKVDEVWNRVQKDHPKAAEMKELLRKAYANRIRGVRALLMGEGETWLELARSGFPKRKELELLCDEQLKLGEQMSRLMERHTDMVRPPEFLGRAVFRKEIAQILRDVVIHGDRMLSDRMEEIYR
ncbi:MAG: hypothetical protein QXO51_02455 [Halobacteria archaeon]